MPWFKYIQGVYSKSVAFAAHTGKFKYIFRLIWKFLADRQLIKQYSSRFKTVKWSHGCDVYVIISLLLFLTLNIAPPSQNVTFLSDHFFQSIPPSIKIRITA